MFTKERQLEVVVHNGVLLRKLPDLKQINPQSYAFKPENEKKEDDYETENIFDWLIPETDSQSCFGYFVTSINTII